MHPRLSGRVYELGVVVPSQLHQNVSWTSLVQLLMMTTTTTSDFVMFFNYLLRNPHFFKVVMPPLFTSCVNDSVAW
jgi:hypothetical protein